MLKRVKDWALRDIDEKALEELKEKHRRYFDRSL
jgi:hypothetical protein